MRVSQKEKERTHGRIVEGAARLVRERGIEGTGVADVMTAAGLTHGGFYRHFETKDALVASALQAAFDEMMSELGARLERENPGDGVADFRAFYLSKGHVEQPQNGCPVAALGGDVARGPDALKAEFGAGVDRMVAALARGMNGSAASRRASALRELARLVGAIVIARASDPGTAGEVLAACRKSSEAS